MMPASPRTSDHRHLLTNSVGITCCQTFKFRDKLPEAAWRWIRSTNSSGHHRPPIESDDLAASGSMDVGVGSLTRAMRGDICALAVKRTAVKQRAFGFASVKFTAYRSGATGLSSAAPATLLPSPSDHLSKTHPSSTFPARTSIHDWRRCEENRVVCRDHLHVSAEM
jgi:hypothetical protein